MECILDIKNPSCNGQFQLHRNIWNCSVTYFSTVNNIQRVNVRVPLVWLEICICFLMGLAILYWGRVVWQVADWSGEAPVFGQKCCIHPNHSALGSISFQWLYFHLYLNLICPQVVLVLVYITRCKATLVTTNRGCNM